MMARRHNFPGRLRPADVAKLPLEVQRARAAYLSDAAAEISDLFQGGVRELAKDDDSPLVSLDSMIERTYQIDTQGKVYEPEQTDDWAND